MTKGTRKTGIRTALPRKKEKATIEDGWQYRRSADKHPNPDIPIVLKRLSWHAIYATITDPRTSIAASGNFTAAVRELKSQLADPYPFAERQLETRAALTAAQGKIRKLKKEIREMKKGQQ